MIRSATQTELISSPVATPGAGAPGEGVFTVEADRQRLGPVMLKALQRTDWGQGCERLCTFCYWIRFTHMRRKPEKI